MGEVVVAEEEMIVPGNRRKMQRRRAPVRELFGARRKEAFLEALSCSCNVTAAAEEAGVAVGTVYNHRRKDAEFRELWWQALEQGAAKLVALRLQREVERAEGRSSPGLEVAMDGPPDERQIADLYKLIGLLREHSRGLSGEGKAGRAPESASTEEICKALAKRLKAFGAREAKKAPPSREDDPVKHAPGMVQDCRGQSGRIVADKGGGAGVRVGD